MGYKLDEFDEILKESVKTEAKVTSEMHEQIMSFHDDKKESNKFLFVQKKLLRTAAIVASLLLVLGTPVIYAKANDLTIPELFSRIWKGDTQVVENEYDIPFEVRELVNDNDNIDVEPIRFVSDGYSTYLVIKVSGKNGYVLPDDLVAFDPPCEGIDTEVTEVRVLKHEDNAFYFSYMNIGNFDDDSVTITYDHLQFMQGSSDEAGNVLIYEGENIHKNHVKIKVHAKVNDRIKIIEKDGHKFQIRALTLKTDYGLFDDIEEAAYDSDNYKWVRDNIYVELMDGSRISFYGLCGEEGEDGFGLYEFDSPVDIDNLKSITIGDKTYPLN